MVKKFSILADERNRNQQNRLEAASPSRLKTCFDCVTVLLKGCYELKLAFFNNDMLLLAQNTIQFVHILLISIFLSLSLRKVLLFSKQLFLLFGFSAQDPEQTKGR